jgi:Holliday junction resolvase RusA-like endonuclease
MILITAADRPFALPPDSIEIVLDLPFPPSVNHIWRKGGGKMFRSARYLRWISNADMAVMAAKQYPRRKITGPFAAHILLSEAAGQGDADNRIKVCLDWLQSRDIVLNDRDCRDVRATWVSAELAPKGCRVTVRSLHGAAA